jgi:hypothetical protein
MFFFAMILLGCTLSFSSLSPLNHLKCVLSLSVLQIEAAAALPTVTLTGSQLATLAMSQSSKGCLLVAGAAGNVSWKAEQTGTVSTGTYSDKFQKRNGQWKCLERTSQVDPNWPAALFQPFVDREKETFRES